MKRASALALGIALASLFVLCPFAADTECRVFSHGKPGCGRIAITFDDGPDPHLTPAILDILDEYSVKATFFVVGKNAKAYPDLIDREIAAGHEIGNHTYSHKYLGGAGCELTKSEISACDSMIFEHDEYCTKLFRPPGGIMNDDIPGICTSMGYSVVLWSVDTRDWSGRSAPEIINEIMKHVTDGAVILMHDGVRGHTAEALIRVIPELKRSGYEFVTVSELIK